MTLGLILYGLVFAAGMGGIALLISAQTKMRADEKRLEQDRRLIQYPGHNRISGFEDRYRKADGG